MRTFFVRTFFIRRFYFFGTARNLLCRDGPVIFARVFFIRGIYFVGTARGKCARFLYPCGTMWRESLHRRGLTYEGNDNPLELRDPPGPGSPFEEKTLPCPTLVINPPILTEKNPG